jgi:hypothetical protein
MRNVAADRFDLTAAQLERTRAPREYLKHIYQERDYRGKGNVLLFPSRNAPTIRRNQPVYCRERLGSFLKYFHRQAA